MHNSIHMCWAQACSHLGTEFNEVVAKDKYAMEKLAPPEQPNLEWGNLAENW